MPPIRVENVVRLEKYSKISYRCLKRRKETTSRCLDTQDVLDIAQVSVAVSKARGAISAPKDNASLIRDSLPPAIQSLLSSVMPPCSDVEMLDAAKYSPDSSSKDPTTERKRSRKKWTGSDSEEINMTITFTHQDDRYERQ